ncbi:hypothetical protein MKW92_040609 [Papaver armeniacum]|nr:hypothetical protein MKW92_040609 [Papaver armeniacum]
MEKKSQIFLIDHAWTFRFSDASKQNLVALSLYGNKLQNPEIVVREVTKFKHLRALWLNENPVLQSDRQVEDTILQEVHGLEIFNLHFTNKFSRWALGFCGGIFGKDNAGCFDDTNCVTDLLKFLKQFTTLRTLKKQESMLIDTALQPRLPKWTRDDSLVDRVINAMWLYLMTCRLADEEKIDETSVWYVMDELGSTLRHSDKPNFRVSPFLYMPDGNLASAIRSELKLCKIVRYSLRSWLLLAFGSPEWLQPTYNLETHLAQLIGDYTVRERDGHDNLWILKPWNMARTIDTTVRLANNQYSVDERTLFEYETHFTVMEFEKEHNVNWSDIHQNIKKMIRAVFESAAIVHPEMHSPMSRAMYDVDVMLDSSFKPKLLEVTYCPDCKRACTYDTEAIVGNKEIIKGKDFFNFVFGCLFLGETTHVTPL